MNNCFDQQSSFWLFCTVLTFVALFSGCSKELEADAYGNFEATEVTVSAQADGRLLMFTVAEGTLMAFGETAGLVDTTQLAAQKDNFVAQRLNLQAQQASLRAQGRAAQSQISEAQAQADAWLAQLNTASVEHERSVRLASVQAATQREVNERGGNVERLKAQVRQAEARIESAEAQAAVYTAQANALSAQIAALDAQRRQIDERLADATITNPSTGTVLTVLARAGEVVRMGSPLYTIADIDPITLRAYATGNQLSQIRLGMTVDVLVDDGVGGLESRQGTVSFIAPEAEFTPTPIQTREERADLVYAFEVQTPNSDGRFKIGMPGEVHFSQATEQ